MSKIALITTEPIAGYIFVYISIFDSATNKPADGGGMMVTYIQNINGVSSTHTVSVSGVRYQIFKSESIAGCSWTIPVIQPDTPPAAPPVNRCDLAINYITVDKPESAPGASDAQVTVNAISSYLPIQYSKDNVNFQASNVFTGLPGGALEIYVTDANPIGCTRSLSVTIPVTQNLLIADPSVSLTGDNISRWNAALTR